MSLFTLFGLSALLNLYIAARLVPDLAGSAVAQIVLAAVLTLCALTMPIGLAARRFRRRGLSCILNRAGLLCMGLFSSLLVLVLTLLWLAELFAPGRLAVAHRSGVSAQAVPAIAGLVTLPGFLNARRTATVVRIDV